MSALNPTAGKTTGGHLPPIPSLHFRRPFFSSSLYFSNPPPVLPLLSFTRTRAASSSPPPSFRIPKITSSNQPSKLFGFFIHPRNSVSPNSYSLLLSPLKTGVVTAITAAVLFISGFHFTLKPNVAFAVSPPPTVEKAETDATSELDPDESAMKFDLRAYDGEVEVASLVFYLQLKIDNWKITAAVQADSADQLEKRGKKVERMLESFKKKNNNSDYRGLKLLFAQIQFIQGNYDKAMKLYDELEKEDPRDCIAYFFQGITYMALEKKSEADKCFENYRKLVPKKHSLGKFFYPSMLATKIFAPKG